MKHGRALAGIILCALIIASSSGPGRRPAAANRSPVPGSAAPAAALRHVQDLARLPVYFVANRGQESSDVLYSARVGRCRVWLTQEGLDFDPGRPNGRGREVVRLRFSGSNPGVRVREAEPAAYREHRFDGPDPSRWITDIPSARAVLYEDVYRNIDLKLYGREGGIEYDWIVRPGGDPGRIRMAFEGQKNDHLDEAGNLLVATGVGSLSHRRPEAYQDGPAGRSAVASEFVSDGLSRYGFRIGPYDAGRDLVIDPYVLAFSTYLGGSNEDTAYDIAFDAEGNLFVSGTSSSTDFPGSKPETRFRNDVYVSKFTQDEHELAFTTFLPAGKTMGVINRAYVAVDAQGSIYLTGETITASFPLKNPFQKKYGGGINDGFITKLSPQGNRIIYSSYLGGAADDYPTGIALTADGEANVVGYTLSSNFPLRTPLQNKKGSGYDGFVVKISADGRSLVFGTYWGGNGDEFCSSVIVDSQGIIYLAGTTSSNNFPILKAFQPNPGGKRDAFWSKLSADGRSLLYSTYLGGSGWDYGYGLGLDEKGSVYIVGSTDAKIPLKTPFQSARKGGEEAFLSKFAPDGRSLSYSTYLGGRGDDNCFDLAVAPNGTAFLLGFTRSTNFPLKSPLQSARQGDADAFLTIVHPSGRSLFFSTLLGGNYQDIGWGVALDDQRRVIAIAGYTNSTDFPLKDPVQTVFKQGHTDAFAAECELK